MLNLAGIDLGNIISTSDFADYLGRIANMIFNMFNQILKFFFQDIQVFHIPIGYIFVSMGILGALYSTLIDNPKND